MFLMTIEEATRLDPCHPCRPACPVALPCGEGMMETEPAPMPRAQAGGIQATARLMRLEAGTYCIFHAPGPCRVHAGRYRACGSVRHRVKAGCG
ncbi:hypothetical protein RAA17_04290 [Komagataeibacter rhaeticus]|nr:hypothetical protein [Komagataeibacter rhaeticus]